MNLKRVTIIRYISLLQVLFIHILNWTNQELNGINIFGIFFQDFATGYKKLNELFLPTFLMSFISGYLFFLKFNDHLDIREIVKKTFSRTKRILVPYVIWCSISFFLYNGSKPILSYFFGLKFVQNPIEFSLINYLRCFFDVELAKMGHLWYIQHLLLFFCFSPIIYFVFTLGRTKSLLVAILIVLCIIFFDYGDFLQKRFAISYIFGAFFALNFRQNEIFINNISYKYLFYSIFGGLVIIYLDSYKIFGESNTKNILGIAVNFCLFNIFSFFSILIEKSEKIPKLINHLTKSSFILYLIHGMIISLLIKLYIQYIKIYNSFALFLMSFLLIILVVVVVHGLYILISKNKFLSLLLNGRADNYKKLNKIAP